MVTNKAQGITHNIKQLGFSGLRAFVFQTNFSNGGYERAPKIQPFHIVKRCRTFPTLPRPKLTLK
jgi:hypothetical protein